MDPETSDSAKGFLMKKIGPLPLVAWVVIGAGAGLVFVYLRRGNSPTNAASSPAVGSGASGSGGSYGGSSGAGGIGQQQGDPFATQNLADSITNLNSFLGPTLSGTKTPGVSSGFTVRTDKGVGAVPVRSTPSAYGDVIGNLGFGDAANINGNPFTGGNNFGGSTPDYGPNGEHGTNLWYQLQNGGWVSAYDLTPQKAAK